MMKLAGRRRLRLSLQTALLSRDLTKTLGSRSCPNRRREESVRSLEQEEEEEEEKELGRRRGIPGEPSMKLRDKRDFVALTGPSKKTQLPATSPTPPPSIPPGSSILRTSSAHFPELKVSLFPIKYCNRPHTDMLQMHWRSVARCCKLLAAQFPVLI